MWSYLSIQEHEDKVKVHCHIRLGTHQDKFEQNWAIDRLVKKLNALLTHLEQISG